jgi:type III restriction enzyme
MLTLRVVERQDIERDFPADPVGYISVMCNLIERECHLTGQFHRLAGLVKDYVETVLFSLPVDMEEDYVLVRLNKPDAKTAIFEAFVEAIRERSVQSQEVKATGEVMHFISTPGYEWSRSVYPGLKTVFNLVACDNEFETEFASFLDKASDVAAYTKNNLYTHFSLDYQNSEGAIRYYYPDFVVRTVTGEKWLVETKGVEDVEVELKDARATQWCRDASAIARVAWQYLKVPYDLFQASTAATFSELVAEIAVKDK